MKHVTTANFPAVIHNSGVPVVVMFYASWCTQCAMMKPIAEEISGKYHAQYLFIEVDIDESPLLAKTYTDDLVPTFVCFKNGTVLASFGGLISSSILEERLKKIFRKS